MLKDETLRGRELEKNTVVNSFSRLIIGIVRKLNFDSCDCFQHLQKGWEGTLPPTLTQIRIILA